MTENDIKTSGMEAVWPQTITTHDFLKVKGLCEANDLDIRILIQENITIRNKIDELEDLSLNLKVIRSEFEMVLGRIEAQSQSINNLAHVKDELHIHKETFYNAKDRFKRHADTVIYLYGLAIVILGIAHLIHVIGVHS